MAKSRQPEAPSTKPLAGSEPVTNVPGTGSGKRADINAPAGGARPPIAAGSLCHAAPGSKPVTNVPGTGSGRAADIDAPPDKT